MNLLFLTPCSSSGPGGVERHVRLVKQELEKRGHRVKELSLIEDVGLKRSDLSFPKGLTFKSEAWKRLWDKRHLIKRADLIHVHDVFWWYLPFRFLYPRKPVFTTFHGWEGVYPPSRSAIIQKRIAQRLSLGTIGVGSFFKKWYGVKPTLATFGVLDPRIREMGKRERIQAGVRVKRPDEIKAISFFGRMEQVNGIEVAIPALNALSKQGVGIRFIGDGSWRPRAEKVGVVTGLVKNPWRYIMKSDLVITSSYLSMLETVALSKPIVSIATNPLKRDYLVSHPLAPYISLVSSSQELNNSISGYNFLKYQKMLKEARVWAMAQTPGRLVDVYMNLWQDTHHFD